MTNGDQQIVSGICVSSTGQATVEPALSNVLFDYALALEEATDLPVDIEHVLAAIVLAGRKGDVSPTTEITSNNSTIVPVLIPHIRTVFQIFGGQVGTED